MAINVVAAPYDSAVNITGVIVVQGANGFGSTNTAIRRFDSTIIDTGTAMTFADSAADGASFTIDEAGVYYMSIQEQFNAGAGQTGISLNSAQLTTIIGSITAANRLATLTTSGSEGGSLSIVRTLAATDVIRVHTDKSAAADIGTRFTIVKLSA